MQRQLKENQDRLSKIEHDTLNIMRKNEDKNDDLKRPVGKNMEQYNNSIKLLLIGYTQWNYNDNNKIILTCCIVAL